MKIGEVISNLINLISLKLDLEDNVIGNSVNIWEWISNCSNLVDLKLSLKNN